MGAILTDTAIRKAKPKEKRYKIPDTLGLYLEVAPNGSKWWRFRYFFNGKDNLTSLGVFPHVSLKMARESRDKMRELLASGKNPKEVKRETHAPRNDSFWVIANKWYDVKSPTWSERHAKTIRLRMDAYFKLIPAKPFSELEINDFLPMLRSIEERGKHEACHRVAQICSQVCKFAKVLNLIKFNPLEDINQVLVKPVHKPMSAIIDPDQIGKLLVDIDKYNGFVITYYAIKIMPYVFTRSGELRGAKWNEINLEEAIWVIPKERIKTRVEHIVPLAPQVVALFEALKTYTAGELCFPSPRDKNKILSDVGLLKALRRMGYTQKEMCIHGFRSLASTRLNEMGFSPDLIEAQLAHKDKNSIRAIYNRATYLDKRRELMIAWANYLDELKNKSLNRMDKS